MRDLVVERAEVFVVGPPTERYAWSESMSEQFMANTVLRLTTRGGLEGVAGAAMCSSHEFDRSVAETLRYLLPEVMGRSALEREALWYRLRTLNTPLVPQAQSLVDIALWDLAAKAADLPLWRMLGGARDAIPAYASTPLLADGRAYVDYVAERAEEGYRAVKFHCWCNPARDLPMVEAVRAAFPPERMALMLDVEQRYDRHQATAAARRLEPLAMTWFEAPLLDSDLDGYAELRRVSTVPILPGGNTVLDLSQVRQGLAMGCVEHGPGGRDHRRRHHAHPQDHGAGRGSQHELRAAVLGLHADPGRQPAPDAGLHELRLVRAAGSLPRLRVRLARRDPPGC